MILNGSGDDLGGRGCEPVYQYDDGIILAAVAMLRDVAFLGRGATVVRDDELSLLQELVGDADALTEQTARIAAQVEDESLEVAEGIERVGNFVFGGLVEAVD